MRQQRGQWDGAQPRTHVIAVLKRHGVEVQPTAFPDQYILIDKDGDILMYDIQNPVLSKTIEFLGRRFCHLHGFHITEFVYRK